MTVRPLHPTETREAAALIARAFRDNPLYCHVYPNPTRRVRGIEVEYRAALRHIFFQIGKADAIDRDGALAGVALWLPDGGRLPWDRELRMLPAMLRAVGMSNMAVATEAFEALDAALPDASHHYLGMMAVDPIHQGQGLGTTLLRAGLARADVAERGCFLQTGTVANVRFYRRHGFEVTDEIDISDGPRHWGMWRPPSHGD